MDTCIGAAAAIAAEVDLLFRLFMQETEGRLSTELGDFSLTELIRPFENALSGLTEGQVRLDFSSVEAEATIYCLARASCR